MPHMPRRVLAGVPLHLVQRGNNRAATFYSVNDFERYREILHHASGRFRCAIHAYVLMTNHVHLLVTPEDPTGPSRMMQLIGRKYVRYVNTRRHRTGTLWEGRFRSSLINSERYFLACSRYIELNPVRAHIAHDADQYRWSSHRYNAFGDLDRLITPHTLYSALGTTPGDRQEAYRSLFQTPIELSTLERIRRATHRGGSVESESEP
jgi:putative transposase